jgi:hypothetical protein
MAPLPKLKFSSKFDLLILRTEFDVTWNNPDPPPLLALNKQSVMNANYGFYLSSESDGAI